MAENHLNPNSNNQHQYPYQYELRFMGSGLFVAILIFDVSINEPANVI